MNFSIAAILSVIGTENFVANEYGQNKNVKLDLARLSNKSARGYTDDEKIDHLVEARNLLQEKGFDCKIMLTQRAQDGSWNSWPHMWVNRPTAATSTSSEVAELVEMNKKNQDTINRLLELLGQQISPNQEEVAETPSTETPDVVDADGDSSSTEEPVF